MRQIKPPVEFRKNIYELNLNQASLPEGWPEKAKKILVRSGAYQSDFDIIAIPKALEDYLVEMKKRGEKDLDLIESLTLPPNRPSGLDLDSLPEGAILKKL